MKDSSGLEELVHKEAAKLERFCHTITSCRVVIERPQKAESSKIYHVRIDLALPNGELVVKHAPTIHGALQDIKVEDSREEAESVLVSKSPERAIREAFHEMRRQVQDYVRRQKGFVKTTHKMATGTVKALFPGDGYGFLEGKDERQVYFNEASVLDGHFDQLRVGTTVRFAEEMGEKGPQASTVAIIHPRKQVRSAAASHVYQPGVAPSKPDR